MAPPPTITWPRRDAPGLHTVPLGADVERLLIGRQATATICVDDLTVSRAHAELSSVDGVWMLGDVGSGGGTYVIRGSDPPRRLTQRERLRHGDRIRVGRTILAYNDPPAPGSEVATELEPGFEIEISPRELDVLRALCAGGPGTWRSNKEIAAALFVAEETVRTHLRHLFGKFGLRDLSDREKRIRLVHMAVERGLV
jgi:DNA-binding CsgD family transcriptional regulator